MAKLVFSYSDDEVAEVMKRYAEQQFPGIKIEKVEAINSWPWVDVTLTNATVVPAPKKQARKR